MSTELCRAPRTIWLLWLPLAIAIAGCANQGLEEQGPLAVRIPVINIDDAVTFLRARRTRVGGTVVDSAAGNAPIVGATVTVTFPGNPPIVRTATTIGNGRFVVILTGTVFPNGGRVDAMTTVDGTTAKTAAMLQVRPN